MDWLLFVSISGILGLVVAFLLALKIIRQDKGPKEMQEIALAIRQGSTAYLKRQYSTIAVIGLILTVVLYFLLDVHTAISFVLGVFCSLLAGYMSMDIATRANLKTASAARKGSKPAMVTAFYGGAVLGLSVMSLSVLGIVGLYLVYGDPSKIVGFGLGASLAALFAQLGGGIFTKAADIGADLVGKIEKGIPEDDPRNPAVIADLVGDNVGDCAGRGADLFESVTAENIGAMILGMALFPIFGINGVLFPLVARGAGILATIIGVFFINYVRKDENLMMPMWRVQLITTFLCAVAFYFLIDVMLGEINLFYAAVVGLVTSLAIGYITEYYTATRKPVKSIAKASQTGAATNIITGLAVGLESTALPIVVLSAAILISYLLGGIFGTAVATMGMLATTGIVLAMDGFGPIADNAGGIVEMSKASSKIRKSTDALDAIGNTTKALAKGFAVGSAALASFLLFQAYLDAAGIFVIDIAIPTVSVGLLLGGLLPFIFSAFAIKAVGNTAFDIIEEVRRQFRENKGIMSGKTKPDYSRAIDISTKASLREMIAPSLLVLISPILVGVILGPEGAGAFLMGATVSGILLALFMNTGGAAWDNAKKYVEATGKKGTELHKAAVVGDTVGDPLKDTAGPSLHVLIKLLNTISLTFAMMFVTYALL